MERGGKNESKIRKNMCRGTEFELSVSKQKKARGKKK